MRKLVNLIPLLTERPCNFYQHQKELKKLHDELLKMRTGYGPGSMSNFVKSHPIFFLLTVVMAILFHFQLNIVHVRIN